jgi:uncharacterized protein (TIGR02246 family)
MRLRTTAALLAMLSLAACAPAETDTVPADSAAAAMADPMEVRQAIDAGNARAAAALNGNDVEGWLTNYTADAVVMAPNQPAWRGTDGLRAGAKGMMDMFTVSNVSFTTEDLKVSGNLAVETGTFEMTMTPKQGKAVTDKGKYIAIWERQADGSWKITRDIFNSDLPMSG